MAISLKVNGSSHSADVSPDTPLLWVIRDTLGMTGTKFGCGMAQCGSCTVHVDGVATRSCVTPVSAVAGKSITTIEGLGGNHPVQKHGSSWTWCNVVIASPARSCRQRHCWPATRTPATQILPQQ